MALSTISIACIGIQNEGNLGAIARVMKNFGAEELILINSSIDHRSKTALDRASHAADILKNARCETGFAVLKKYDLIIGTTAKVGTAYNILRLPSTPRQLHEQLKKNPKNKIIVVLGREDHGLSNEELALCDLVVSIPASKTYSIMNISHACAIVLYELFTARADQTSLSHVTPASRLEHEHALLLAHRSIGALSFSTDAKKRTQEKLWKKIIFKSFLTKREAGALMGFFKKILRQR